jgi:phosphoenolpyruvate carboxykinase (ATP)
MHGIHNVGNVYWNLPTPLLYEEVIRRREARLSHLGPIVVRTGQHTGRSPNDKYVVRNAESEHKVWWGKVNHPMSEETFEHLHQQMLSYFQGRDVFVQDCFAGADPDYRLPIRVITETAWHSLFAHNMFIRPSAAELEYFAPEFTVLQAPGFHASQTIDGIYHDVFIVINFSRKLVLISGTQYAGEIKKSIFTVLNYLLPQRNVLSMHCSANVGPDGDTAIFFGLSGTGKTTLSADPNRTLIGDDEHGWSDNGIFNFEGGCYAKVINLSAQAEPEIYAVTRRFGTLLENVALDSKTGRLDLNDASLTENTRAAYPIDYIPNASATGLSGHPTNVIMLTCDAFGVLPPISKLTPEQAMFHFLSGYTARVAGTEKGVTEPSATFSACFGAPFLALPPAVYAALLGEKIATRKVNVWLVNTGWTGGPYGVGQRMPIRETRALISAALDGSLAKVDTVTEPYFGLSIPTACSGVSSDVLNPENTWTDKDAYAAQARKLAQMFVTNFAQFAPQVSDAVKAASPKLG